MSKDYNGWYCAQCNRLVDGREVTFTERHDECGRTITDDVPPDSARIAITSREIVPCAPMPFMRAYFREEFISGLSLSLIFRMGAIAQAHDIASKIRTSRPSPAA